MQIKNICILCLISFASIIVQVYNEHALQRKAVRLRLERHPDAKRILKVLQEQYRVGVISDAQSACARPEMRATRIKKHFPVRIISGGYVFCKPDLRPFHLTCDQLWVAPHEAIMSVTICSAMGTVPSRPVSRLSWSTRVRESKAMDVAADYVAKDLYQVLKGWFFVFQ